MKKQIILYAIIFLLLGLLIGYCFGVFQTLSWGIDQMINFASMKGIDIEVDKKAIVYMAQQWIIYSDEMGFSGVQPSFINISVKES